MMVKVREPPEKILPCRSLFRDILNVRCEDLVVVVVVVCGVIYKGFVFLGWSLVCSTMYIFTTTMR